MKRLLSVFLFLFCCVIAADAQDDAVQYDSIMNLMKNKKIPLMERYYMTGDIEYLSREHPSLFHCSHVRKSTWTYD